MPMPARKKKTKNPNTSYGHFRRDVLTEESVKAVKERLWYGESTPQVGKSMNIPGGTILNIYIGHRWANVPWPNRATGAMPRERKDLIDQLRKKIHEEELPKLLRRYLKLRERGK